MNRMRGVKQHVSGNVNKPIFVVNIEREDGGYN